MQTKHSKDYARLCKLWVVVDDAGIWQSRPDSKAEATRHLQLRKIMNSDPSKTRKRVVSAKRCIIEAALNAGTYAGLGASPAVKMEWCEFNNFCAGQLVVAIGRGDFTNEVTNVVRLSMAWHEYHERRKQLIAECGLRPDEFPI